MSGETPPEAAGPDKPPFPARGRLVGVDHGAVRIGLAVCDVDQRLASPLDIYTRRGETADAQFFAKLARTEAAVGWVVGLPIHMSGEEGVQAKKCREFGAWLAAATGLPVEFVDERCTTAAAEDALWDAGLSHQKRKKRRDSVAAHFILQGYLDVVRRNSPPAGTDPDRPPA